MCGIAGICDLASGADIDINRLERMMAMIAHRGPDEAGIYLDDCVGLGHVRLSIIDLVSGVQPIHNEDRTLWITYNGEVFNYIELQKDLKKKGHRFYTTSDTETILHLYEEKGTSFLEDLNGQFALAIWDSRKQQLLLARDRVGIRPLFYARVDNTLIFGSEIKALLAHGTLSGNFDPSALDQVFTFWTTLTPQTIFKEIYSVPPGHYLQVTTDSVNVKPYWRMPLPGDDDIWPSSPDALSEQIGDLLQDAVRLRLRADVPVGCYLSGGLDSSALTTLVAKNFNHDVQSFGIRFEETTFDEGSYQNDMVSFLGVGHTEINVSNEMISNAFSDVIWHCETPVLRTAPVPLFLLSALVHDSGLKVVLTGEGADEIFGGYNLFREAKIRRFWARQPNSERRADLIGQLYPYIFNDRRMHRLVQSFFAQGLEQAADPLYSHLLRWNNTARIKTFFSDEMKQAVGPYDALEQLRDSLPVDYGKTHMLSQAQYLEAAIFLSNYLLASQGDRMAMAHSLEIRVPYLDHRIIEFMSRVPAQWKILGLKEKYLLKRCFRNMLPTRITDRSKHPYRAPIDKSLFSFVGQGYGEEVLSQRSLAEAALFSPANVRKLLQKLKMQRDFSEMDNMALAGVLSGQIVYDRFVKNFPKTGTIPLRLKLIVDHREKSVNSHHGKRAC